MVLIVNHTELRKELKVLPKRKFKLVLILLLVVIIFSGCLPEDTLLPEDSLSVHFIDVGQGDSILLLDSGEAMLIDSGIQSAGKTVADYIRSLGISKLDYVVATHNHSDHTGGLLTVIKTFDVDHYFITESEETKASQKALEAAKEQGCVIENPSPGKRIQLGESIVTVVGPLENYKEANNDSIVLKVSHGENTFLLTGDMERTAERDLVESGIDLEADVLKVGHHGSATSSSYIFLRAVNPEYSIISCGQDNDYGHPHEEPMSRLNDVGSTIFQTNKQGTIIATSLNNEITFNVSGKEPTQKHQESKNGLISGGIIGNLNSKVYHLPSCSSLPKESNRIYFSDFEEALNQGYHPCSHCDPPS